MIEMVVLRRFQRAIRGVRTAPVIKIFKADLAVGAVFMEAVMKNVCRDVYRKTVKKALASDSNNANHF